MMDLLKFLMVVDCLSDQSQRLITFSSRYRFNGKPVRLKIRASTEACPLKKQRDAVEASKRSG